MSEEIKCLKSKFCDFQIHSPRDPQYKGWKEENMTLEGLYEWGEALLDKCIEKGLEAIAVTDHHDLWPGLTILEISKLDKYKDIWVFPGMELTTSEGLQAILIFDPSIFKGDGSYKAFKTEAVQGEIFGVLGESIKSESINRISWDDFESLKDIKEIEKRGGMFKSPMTERLKKDLDVIANDLEGQFQDKYLLLPNLEKSKHGIFGNEAGRGVYLKAGNWLIGGIVGGEQETDKDAIEGKKIKDFGSRVVTCLRTSDQRGKDGDVWFSDYFGQKDRGTFLKLSEPTTISVSQALISGKGKRVFREKPNEPIDRITKFWINQCEIFDSSNLSLSFVPNQNTFIGGRGTGKSLIISGLMRIFGADQEWIEIYQKDELETLPVWFKRHLALFDEGGPFSNENIEIGVEYTIQPSLDYRITLTSPGLQNQNHWKLYMRQKDEWELLKEIEVKVERSDFQPLFFLQGEMSALTGEFPQQQDIQKIIEGESREERQKLRESLKRWSSDVKSGHEFKRKLMKLELQNNEIKAQTKQKIDKKNAYSRILEKGLEPNEKALVEASDKVRAGKETSEIAESIINELLLEIDGNVSLLQEFQDEGIESLKKILSVRVDRLDLSGEPYIKGLVNILEKVFPRLKSISLDVNNEMEAVGRSKSGFEKKASGLFEKSKNITRKQAERSEAAKQIELIQKEVVELNKRYALNKREIKKIQESGIISAGEKALANYKKSIKRYTEQLVELANKISGSKELSLYVKIIPGGRYEGFVEEMERVAQGAHIKNRTWTSFKEFLKDHSNPAEHFAELISSIIDSFSKGESELPRVWGECGFSDKIFKNLLQKTSADDWVDLYVFLADDKVEINYKRKKDKPIPISHASPGERAVELLKLALETTQGPLIIDQPEDDLDNNFLAKNLVDLVHKAKVSNQLIFTSHNANLIVHGDSEVINVMEAKEAGDGKGICSLYNSGTIDQYDICFKIEDIVEGGREAFEKRRRKYYETRSGK